MRWIEISIEATAESADAVTGILLQAGCAGTAQSSPPPPDDAYPPSPPGEGRGEVFPSPSPPLGDARITAYLPMDDRLESRLETISDRVRRLPELGLTMRSTDVRIKWIDDADWATAWRKYFKPMRFGRIVIKPSWEDFEPVEGDIVVELDPGMAFGTGNHPTTSLCLYVLQDYVRGGETVLDVGTGSGILAMAAALLGAERVVGLDNDTVAVEAAQANVEHLGLQDRISIGLAESPLAFDGEADLVIANIIPNVIIPMAPALAAKIRPGGTLITSGIVTERADEVKAALEAAGLGTVEQRQDGDWVAIVSKRSA